MGLLDFLKRVFGLSAPSAHACRVCGSGIPERDLEAGRAVVVARRAYCRSCVAERTRGSGNVEFASSSSHAAR